jgi:rhodanese-related sulfurtransferase
MTTYADLVADARQRVGELMPWDLAEALASDAPPLVLDVREPAEFAAAHIAGALHVPRGLLEAACDWDYDDTVPELVLARSRPVVVVCRSGNRSLLAADAMRAMGFEQVKSLRTGVRGWNDYELPLVDGAGRAVDIDHADALLAAVVRPEQRAPQTSPAGQRGG